MSINITHDIEVIADAVLVETAVSGDTVSASDHEITIEIPDENVVTGTKKEYSIVGDGLYASVTAEEAPAWLTSIVDSVVDNRIATGFANYNGLVTDVQNAISTLNIANNNYAQVINTVIDQEAAVTSVVEQINSTYGYDITSTITNISATIASELDSRGLTVQSLDSSYKGYTDTKILNLNTTLSSSIGSYAASLDALTAAYEDESTGLLATASAVDGLQVFVGVDGATGNPNHTGLLADVAVLKKQIDGSVDIYAATHDVVTGTDTGTVDDDSMVLTEWPYALWVPMTDAANLSLTGNVPTMTQRTINKSGVPTAFPIETDTVYKNTFNPADITYWLYDASTSSWNKLADEAQYNNYTTLVRERHKGDTYIKYSVDANNVNTYDAAFKFILTNVDATDPYATDAEGYTWAKVVDNDAQAAYVKALNAYALADGKMSVYFALESSTNPNGTTYLYYYDPAAPTGQNLKRVSDSSVVTPAEGDNVTVKVIDGAAEDLYIYVFNGTAWVASTPQGLVAKAKWAQELDAYLGGKGVDGWGGETSLTNSIVTTSNGEIKAAFEYDATLYKNGQYYKTGFGLDTTTTGGDGSAGNPFTSEFWINAERFVLTNPNYPGMRAYFTTDQDGIRLGANYTEATKNITYRQAEVGQTPPPASNAGDSWFATDTLNLYVSNGTSWELSATVGAPPGTFVNGVAVETVSSAVTNFNNSNDRDASAVVNPSIPGGGTAIDHTEQNNGSVDISFEWAWGGNEKDIDGFIVYVRIASVGGAYTFGDAPPQETAYIVPANKRGFFLYGVTPTEYYSFAVQAYRSVHTDVDATGVIKSNIVQATYAGENPYRPSSNIAFNGDLVGTLNGTTTTASVASVITNFNSNNDRDNTPIVAPTVAADTTAIDHTDNDNGSADISFEWSWGGVEDDIDGFIIHLRSSDTAGSYTFTGGPQETTYIVPADRRAFLLYGVIPTNYYTFGVQAYRMVDSDVNSAGIIKSTLVKPTLAAENPYQPATSIAFAGDLTGTINGGLISAGDVNVWDKVSGTGKPEDYATVTGLSGVLRDPSFNTNIGNATLGNWTWSAGQWDHVGDGSLDYLYFSNVEDTVLKIPCKAGDKFACRVQYKASNVTSVAFRTTVENSTFTPVEEVTFWDHTHPSFVSDNTVRSIQSVVTVTHANAANCKLFIRHGSAVGSNMTIYDVQVWQITDDMDNNAQQWAAILGADKPADNADVTSDVVNNQGLNVNLNGGALYSGKTTYDSVVSGWWIGKDAGDGKLHFGNDSKWFKWDGTDLEIVGGLKTSSGTGQRVEINETSNEMSFYADRGDGVVEEVANIGVKTTGGDSSFVTIGSPYATKTCIFAWNKRSNAIIAISTEANAVKGTSTSAVAGYFTSSTMTAVYGYSVNSNGVWGSSSYGDGGRFSGGSGQRGIYSYVIGTGSKGVEASGVGYDFYASGVGSNYGPFTGAHDSLLIGDAEPGDIICDQDLVFAKNVSNTIHEGVISTEPNKPAIGVLVSVVDIPVHATSENGIAALLDYEGDLSSYRYATVNAVGEGMVNVCSEGGNISAGDLIVTSNTPGKGMKQADDFVRSYTVARARESVVWADEISNIKLISCIYLCG